MKKKNSIISVAMVIAMTITAVPGIPLHASADDGRNQKPLKLQYLSPADKGSSERNNWERWALPLGNGHIGAMVFGRTETERVQLNEKTLWSGGTGGTDDAEGGEYKKRDPLSDAFGNVDAAGSGAMEKYIDKLFQDYYNNSTAGNSPAQSGDMKILPNNRSALGDYLNFADMYMDFNHTEDEVEGYRRELDLREALSTVSYNYQGTHYTREAFTNYPDNVMVFRITADKPGSINMVLRPIISDLGTTSGSHSKKVTKEGTVVADEDTQTITMDGMVTNNNMKFAGKFKVVNQGGLVTAQNPEAAKGQLTVEDADSVVIYVSLATNYKNDWPDYRQDDAENYAQNYVTDRIENALQKEYDQLWNSHLSDYQELFSRVELDFGGTYSEAEETDQLLKKWNAASAGTQNHYLEELYFQYGRYMAIASSRSDTLPSNLQGIWNDRVFADWQSDYHTNINLQMNYWPVYSTNLAEIGESLVDYVDSLQEPGALTAQKLFGADHTWMVNCSANALGFTGNINSNASMAVTANAFILQNVYDHFQYTQDTAILKDTIYPMMTGACNFFLQTLRNGRSEADQDKLFMVPSFSSEQGPWTVGAAFDQQLIYMLFEDTLDASEKLGIDNEFTQKLKNTMSRLYPVNIGDSGQIKEWQQEGQYNRYKSNPSIKIGDDGHRHNSQLMMLHPGNFITTETPELMDAAKTTLQLRGDAATGWSMGQKFNMWTRLQDGNHAYNGLFKNLMKNGTATNLFDLHPPFQIDGNFGGTAGIAELLMQSHAGYISILPALPDELPSGTVKGLAAQGNFVVDLSWEDMKLTDLLITSRSGNRLSLKCGVVSQIIDETSGAEISEISQDSNGAISFDTEAGHSYRIYNGEEQAMLYAQTVVSDIENMGLVSYQYTSETGKEFEEALLACQRMIEQKNYIETNVDKTVNRLLEAERNLIPRENEEYVTAAALRFLENASKVNYIGTDTEDNWRQQVEYGRADLLDNLENGSMDPEEMVEAAESLVNSSNKIAGYSESRLNLFDFIKKAKTVKQESRPDEVWMAYQTAIDQGVRIFANPKASEKDLKNAISRLKKVVETIDHVFEINASAQGNGSISPSGVVEVLGGGSQQFKINPDKDSIILDLLINGNSVGAVNDYTIEDIKQDMDVKALFQEITTQKTEVEILLENAIARVGELNEEDYIKADWVIVQEALEDAMSEDLTNEEMAAKADALLTAIDGLHMWGQPVRTEAENGFYPVQNFDNAGVYNDPANWGDIELGERKLIGGYPDGGPVKATGSAGKEGQWVKQDINNASENSQVLCKTDGAWAKFRFEGNRVRYITESAQTGAVVTVYIDDKEITKVVCYETSSATNPRGVVKFDSEDYDLNLNDGVHELKLVGNTQPSGAAHPIFRVDAFDEYTETQQVTAKKELAELIARATALKPISYTQDSWQEILEKLHKAEELMKDSDVSQQQITDGVNELQTAIDDLEDTVEAITGITPLMPVTVAYQTTAEALLEKLQKSVVVSAGSQKTRVDINWSLDQYNGGKAGMITLEGELILPEHVPFKNPEKLKAKAVVIVAKGEAKITLGNLKQTEGSVTSVTAKTEPEGLTVKILYDGSMSLPNVPGTYKVEAIVEDGNYEGTRMDTLLIEKKQETDQDKNAAELEAAKKALQAEAERAKAYVQAGQKDYTTESWNRFMKAYNNAIRDISKSDKAAVEELYKELSASIDGLTKKIVQPEKQALKAPAVSKVTAVARKSGVQIEVRVNKVSNARSYTIYRKVSGKKAVKAGTTTSGKFYDTRRYVGKSVKYTAVAVPKDMTRYIQSKAGSGKSIKLKKFSKKVSVSQKGQKVTIQWKQNKGAKGYAIYRSEKKNGTYKLIKTITKGSILQYTDKKVKKGKRYYYKITARISSNYTGYRTSDGIRIKK